MKLALVFMLAFVTMSYQQQFQKQMYLVGENRNQQDQPTRIYNLPIVIKNNFNPNTEGLLRGLPQQGTMLDFNDDRERSFDAIDPSSVVSLSVGQQYNPGYFYRSAPSQSPHLFREYVNGYKILNNNEAYSRHASGDDYVDNQEAVSRDSYRPSPAVYSPSQQRLFFNALGFSLVPITNSNNANNPFRLNPTIIITSTVNTTTVTTCVSATEFLSGTAVKDCRRRRRGMEYLLDFDDLVGSPSIAPSAVEKIEPTLTPEDYEESNAKLHELLATSKDDLLMESNSNDRDKRQFFATRTLISYVIFTSTSTKQIQLVGTGTSSALNCKPSGFVICT